MSNFYDPPNAINTAGMTHVSIEDVVTAAGTDATNAYPITKQVTILHTVAAGTGVILPVAPDMTFTIKHAASGTEDCLVYPAIGRKLDGTVDAVGTITHGGGVVRIVCIPSENEQPGETVSFVTV